MASTAAAITPASARRGEASRRQYRPLSNRSTEPRQVDRTVAEIAAANEGRYSTDIHLQHDPTASETFAATHVRRLEAIRRATGAVEREANGTWTIAPDHLDRVRDYERRLAKTRPVAIETLSSGICAVTVSNIAITGSRGPIQWRA